jgi:hypothetical protein
MSETSQPWSSQTSLLLLLLLGGEGEEGEGEEEGEVFSTPNRPSSTKSSTPRGTRRRFSRQLSHLAMAAPSRMKYL